MLTQIDLIIYSIDKDNIYILSTEIENNILPSIILDENNIDKSNLDIDHYLENLIAEYTNIDPKWAYPKLIDIKLYTTDTNIETHIYYASYIPNVAKTNGYWIPIDKNTITNTVIKKILCLR